MSEIALSAAGSPAPPPVASIDAREREIWGGIAQTRTGPYRCLVSDLSPGGVSIRLPERLHPISTGEPVTLIIGALGMFRGEVAWVHGTMAGLRFTNVPRSAGS